MYALTGTSGTTIPGPASGYAMSDPFYQVSDGKGNVFVEDFPTSGSAIDEITEGTVQTTPPAQVPEIANAVVLPIAGFGLIGVGVLIMTRRQRRQATI